jgi:hypothetical protein
MTIKIYTMEKTKRKAQSAALQKGTVNASSFPRLFIEENQEFIIDGQIFTWYFSNHELRQGIVLNRKGMIEPSKFSVGGKKAVNIKT